MDAFEKNYDDALRIFAICTDQALPDEDARLLTYIHAKANESENGVSYFDDPSRCDEDALRCMLGELSLIDLAKDENSTSTQFADKLSGQMVEYVALFDARFEQEGGQERRITGELRSRLRLYKDAAFRKKMTDLYTTTIAPKIYSYKKDDVSRAFLNHRIKSAKAEHEFNEIMKS